MFINILATRSNPFDFVDQVYEPENLLDPNASPSFQTALEPTIDDIETENA